MEYEVSSPTWVARVAAVDENVLDSALVVGLAEDDSGEGRQLVFQCSLQEPDEQEQRLGQDSYCVLNETGGIAYGGVEVVTFSPARVSFRFSLAAVEKLSLSSQDLIVGIAPEAQVENFRTELRRVLTYGNPQKVPSLLGF
ncbi:Imm10 family immunity protein [Streptomyces canus]|uniref:Imm10 family immunity protein n=1 Tax=Streptomyces canus TaxID=58343 RepID=UPI0003729109|nr:Imm10 family immunity protein [Streptomyces canus]